MRLVAACGLLASALLPLSLEARPSGDEPRGAEAVTWLSERWARTDLEDLARAASAWKAARGSWPADCLRAAAETLQPAPGADPWGHPYRCETDGERLVVVSSGPDGAAGTGDDLRVDASSVPPRPPRATEPATAAGPEEAATAQSMTWLGQALRSYHRREGRYPVTDRVEHLERFLVPEHLAASAWASQDAWGRPYRYRTTDLGTSYTLASAGSDGRWEPQPPTGPRPPEGADLVIADGRPVRWPGALPAAADADVEGRAPVREPEPEPADASERTRRRMERLAGLVSSQRRDGRYAESDDAERLGRELGAPATDGWGRPLHYLSADGGRRFALVSAGPDGRLARGMEAYARGAEPSADDVVLRRP